MRIGLFTLLMVFMVGCNGDLRTTANDTRDVNGNPVGSRWSESPAHNPVEEPVSYVERAGGLQYGLPSGATEAVDPIDGIQRPLSSIADLIALLPEGDISFSDPNIFSSDRNEPQCDNGRVAVDRDLPMIIDAVVTLHPRQYTKVPVCDQDERNYGTYTVEDDTGGIVVLRDSRVAWFQAGDRIRLTVDAAIYTFTGPETRSVLTATVEPLFQSDNIEDRVIYYTRQTDPFSLVDITETRRIEGLVAQAPTNKNFSTMILSDRPLPQRGNGEVNEVCMVRCAPECAEKYCKVRDSTLCREQICPALCENAPNDLFTSEDDEAEALIPICWEANLDVELARRGYTYAIGSRLAVTGPVVESFGLKIWVMRLGQVEVLDE
jgi:hypothetical protein